MKEIKDDLSAFFKEKYCRLEDCIVKILILSKMLHKFNVIPIKISTLTFVDIDKVILKFVWKSRGTT